MNLPGIALRLWFGVTGVALAEEPIPPVVDSPEVTVDHSGWDSLLRTHVREGDVDYEGFLKDRPLLDSYLRLLEESDPEALSRQYRMAFWINAYNAHMVAAVLDAWPIRSVLDIGRIAGLIPTGEVFRETRGVGGMQISLDGMEHDVLRARFGDPRVHAALNCASRSCPSLAPRAYSGDSLDVQLEEAMLGFLLDGERNRLGADPPQLSKIFHWYREDFEGEGSTIWGWVREFLPPEVSRELDEGANPGFLSYDWALNRSRD